MASPPYNPNEGKPAASDLISGYPAVEQLFRDIIESWLLAISTNQGVLRSSAMPAAVTFLNSITLGDGTFTGSNLHQLKIWGDDRAGIRIENNDTDGVGRVSFYHDDTLAGGLRYNHTDDKMHGFAADSNITTTTISGFMVGREALINPANSEFGVSMSTDGLLTVARSGDLAGRFKRTGAGSLVQFYQGSTVAGVVSVSGSTTTYGTSSDGRLKEDLLPFRAGNIIDDIEVWNFRWKDTDKRGHGVVAQDMEEVYPDAVTYDDKSDTYMVDYSKFVPLLLQEVKDLRERVAALEG